MSAYLISFVLGWSIMDAARDRRWLSLALLCAACAAHVTEEVVR